LLSRATSFDNTQQRGLCRKGVRGVQCRVKLISSTVLAAEFEISLSV
jgi:hypothetical protein